MIVPVRLSTGAIVLALFVFGSACGGSGSTPSRTATTKPTTPQTRSQPAIALTAEQTSAAQAVATASPEAASCPDPYVNGAPFSTTSGDPIRLRPTGTPPALSAFQPAQLLPDSDLERIVRDSIGDQAEHFSVAVKNLADGRGVLFNPAHGYYTASLYKTWVMLEAYHQRGAGLFSFDERFIVSDYYEHLRLNEGELPACSQVTAQDALHAMMSVSDNVAANLLYDRLGYDNVNNMLRQLGLAYSGINNGGELFTTAGGMETLLEAIADGQAVSPGASEEMIALLESETINDRIPALLPPGTPVAHKTGNWDNATHDAGIVYSPKATYVIVVLTDYGYSDGGAGRIAQLSKAVYDFYSPS